MADDRPEPPPASRPAAEVVASLGTSVETGLAAAEGRARLARHGPNLIPRAERRGPLRLLALQFADVLVLMLVAAAVVAGLVGDAADTIAIAVIVVLNAILGFVQAYRAERALESLTAMAAPAAVVRRDGRTVTIPAADVVPGDIVLVEAGNVVPADARLVEAAGLAVDESALTGEAEPAGKQVAPVDDHEAPIGDRRSMAWKGTIVVRGRAAAVVTATGARTELGRIATLLGEAEEIRTPLQQRLDAFGRRLALVILGICAIIFAAGLLRGEAIGLMFLTALSLAVAAVPEALPAVVTVALSLGARRMVRRQALVRHLPAVETLGSVTVICSDKTGTLTENRMRAEAHWIAGRPHPEPPESGHPVWSAYLDALALCADVHPAGDGFTGDPTEVALVDAAAAAGVRREDRARALPRAGELPFTSERRMMTTLHRDGNGVLALTKGSPEAVLDRSGSALLPSGAGPLDRAAVEAMAGRMAAEGRRVLAVAIRRWPTRPDLESPDAADRVETDLAFVGLAGLVDPPRPEAAAAVATCRAAGIVPVMITGDHPQTARAIAARVGILEPGGRTLTGAELARLDADALGDAVAHVRVYARVAPDQKIAIVRALQRRGAFVAMTGDGVNDAPALKQADIGVAMGRGGTDVAREAADMVLVDDNFATIVAAVEEGRRIFDNIRRFIRFVMTGNSGEIWTLLLAPLLGLPLPLLPIQILWVNLVTDGLPGLALALEPADRRVMQRPPRPPDESVFAHGLGTHILWVGLLIGGVTLVTQAVAWTAGSPHWRSMTFTVLALAQMFHVLAIRSERESLLAIGPLSNPALLLAVASTVVLQAATLYVPALHDVFETAPLTAGELAFCVGMASTVFVAVEGEKWLVRRGWLYRDRPR